MWASQRSRAGWPQRRYPAVHFVSGHMPVVCVVKVGQRNGLQAQIVSGINAGDNVIVHPDDQVKDGVRVAVR